MNNQAADGGGAAVVGEGLMTFQSGVSREAREDVLLANSFALSKTLHDYQAGLVSDWFNHYKNQLKYLGWDAAPPPGSVHPNVDRERMIDEVLSQIGEGGRQHYADSAAQGLEALLANEQALDLFERSTRALDSLRFQLIPCAQVSSSRIDMVLYHHELETTSSFRRFLFGERSPKMRTLARHIELVRFNTRLFRGDKRDKVLVSASAQNRQSIIELS